MRIEQTPKLCGMLEAVGSMKRSGAAQLLLPLLRLLLRSGQGLFRSGLGLLRSAQVQLRSAILLPSRSQIHRCHPSWLNCAHVVVP